MEKQQIVDKIEKFDLTEEQLIAIDKIIAGEIEEIDFKEVLFEIAERLSKVTNNVIDISDVGNEIGIAVGKYIKNEEDERDFVDGIYHGISLIDGTHDSGEVICVTKFKKKNTKMKKKGK
jgi:hypothetical protein